MYPEGCSLCSAGRLSNSWTADGPSLEGWYRDLLTPSDALVLEHSGKMVLLFEILRMAEELGDKV